MKSALVALASVSFCLSVPCAAQSSPSDARTVQLSKVVLDTQTDPVTARVKGGTLCVFPSRIELPKEKKSQDQERYDALFSKEMKQRGFVVVSPSGDLFADESKDKGDLLVGATVTPVNIDICSSVSGYKGTIRVNVEWQLYDRSTQSVVATSTTSGEGTLVKFSQSGWVEMWNSAFVDALQQVAGEGIFDRHPQSAPTSAVEDTSVPPAAD